MPPVETYTTIRKIRSIFKYPPVFEPPLISFKQPGGQTTFFHGFPLMCKPSTVGTMTGNQHHVPTHG
jgi:hypothetical protein